MNIIMLLWWSLGRGNPVVPSRWQATDSNKLQKPEATGLVVYFLATKSPLTAGPQSTPTGLHAEPEPTVRNNGE
jgi:hypothetical protein